MLRGEVNLVACLHVQRSINQCARIVGLQGRVRVSQIHFLHFRSCTPFLTFHPFGFFPAVEFQWDFVGSTTGSRLEKIEQAVSRKSSTKKSLRFFNGDCTNSKQRFSDQGKN